jgi:predicted membrane-bound mannosyltransferase
LAIFALIYAFSKKVQIRPLIIFLSVSVFAHLSIYSLIAYKTPWLMLLPWSLACLLAGVAFSGWAEKLKWNRITLILLLLTGLSYQINQSLLANGRYANDARNPYAYVPTSQDAPRIEVWLSQLAAMPDAPSLEPIAVVGQEYWPLPWYLRAFKTIGYWPVPPPELPSFPLVFAMPAQSADCNDSLFDTHTALPRGLRSEVSVTLYLRNDLWNQWMQQPGR